jgi:hypothetical protein
MPLNARAFHRLLRNDLDSWFAMLGFAHAPKTTSASWIKAIGTDWLVIWCQPSQWNDRYSAGYSFTVEFRLTRTPAIGAWGPRSRLPKLLNEAEKRDLLRLENTVVRKLPPPDTSVATMLSDEKRLSWLAQWRPRAEPYRGDEDVWLRYWDEADVENIAVFLQRVLPSAIARFLDQHTLPPTGPAAGT